MASEKRIAMIFRIVDATLLGIFNSIRFLARILPPSVLCAAADYIGYAVYHIRRSGRTYLLKTLREALPEVSDEKELEWIAKRAFGAPFRAMLDLVLMERYGDRIMKNYLVPEEAFRSFDGARDGGKGIITVCPHLGAVGVIFSLNARLGRKYTPLVMDPAKTPIPRYLTAMAMLSATLGGDEETPVFWTGGGTIPMVKEHLGKGKGIGITYDMAGGTIVDFFGRPAALASGIAHFACDTGAPILAGFVKRGKDPLDYRLLWYGEIPYELTGDREADVETILKKVVKAGEDMIREAPEQWIGWFGLRSWRKRAEKMMREAKPEGTG